MPSVVTNPVTLWQNKDAMENPQGSPIYLTLRLLLLMPKGVVFSLLLWRAYQEDIAGK